MRSAVQADSIAALREIAKRRLPQPVFDFMDGGADEEITLRANLEHLRQVEFRPRYLRDVAVRDSVIDILGVPADLPLIIAPTGLAALGWPAADVLLARAAAKRRLPFVISTSSSVRMEEIAAAAEGARLWFQVYIYKDRELVRSLISRAANCGVDALVLTVDTPVLGWRRRDHANQFTVPLRPTLNMVLEFARCWRWTLDIAVSGVPKMQNFVERGGSNDVASLASLMTSNMDATVSWSDLAWLRDLWPGKLIIKGLSSAPDAEEAVRQGVDAVWVSNHGGRQLDGARSAISALPAIVDAVDGRAEVYMDGGVRKGGDIAKAVALGARAAAVGRATLFGVSAGGQTGADQALSILSTEFDRCLALMGSASANELDCSFVQIPPSWR